MCQQLLEREEFLVIVKQIQDDNRDFIALVLFFWQITSSVYNVLHVDLLSFRTSETQPIQIGTRSQT